MSEGVNDSPVFIPEKICFSFLIGLMVFHANHEREASWRDGKNVRNITHETLNGLRHNISNCFWVEGRKKLAVRQLYGISLPALTYILHQMKA